MDTKKKETKDKEKKVKDKKDKKEKGSSKEAEKVIKVMQKEFETWIDTCEETANIGTCHSAPRVLFLLIFLVAFEFRAPSTVLECQVALFW